MALRSLTRAPFSTTSAFHLSRPVTRSFHRSLPRLETPTNVLPVRKPVGTFRGGFFGFLLGSTLAGASVYYYVYEESKIANELLTEDIYTLQASVQRLSTYVQSLEDKMEGASRRK